MSVNPKYTYLQRELEKIPTIFAAQRETVYEGRNVLKRISLGGVDMVVKSFKVPHIVNRVVYSFFRPSKAARSYLYSMKLQQHGYGTPEPIAMIEYYHRGFLSESYYVSCYDGGETVRALMEGKVEGNEARLSAFARYTVSLHEAGILHLDYSPGNILIHDDGEGQYSFSLVDVNRMRLLPQIDCDTACRNFCRLCISREVQAYIMREYAALRGWEVEPAVRLALHYSDRFFMQYMYRRAARKWETLQGWSSLLLFRLFRRVRRSHWIQERWAGRLLAREKQIYDAYLCSFDYRRLLAEEYR